MFLTFKKWQLQMITLTSSDDIVTCPTCNGEGEIISECDHCGHDVEESCHLCDASGEVIFNELTEVNKLSCFSRKKYNQLLVDDIKKFMSWNKVEIVDLAKYGFALASDTRHWRKHQTMIVEMDSRMIIGDIAI